MIKIFGKSTIVLLVLLVFLSLITTGCSSDNAGVEDDVNNDEAVNDDAIDDESDGTAEPLSLTDVTIMASPVGGAWYPLAVSLGQLLEKEYGTRVNIGPGGGVSNIIACHNGEGHFGITTSNALFDALSQDPPFDQQENIIDGFYMIASIYPNVAHFMVLEESDIYTIDDLRGKAVNVKPRGWSAEAANKQILEALGMSYDDFGATEFLGYSESVELMVDGRIDAIMNPVAPAPHSAYIDLTTRRDVRFLELTDDEIESIRNRQPAFQVGVIPAGTYNNVDSDVKSVQIPLVLIASKETPDDVAYAMAKHIIENIDTLAETNVAMKNSTPDYIASDIGIETHPGALKYYEEIGIR